MFNIEKIEKNVAFLTLYSQKIKPLTNRLDFFEISAL